MKTRQQVHPDRVAVIDIGSNSARLAIYDPQPWGGLRILGSARQPLGLVRDVDRNQRLTADSVAALIGTLADFRAMIRAHAAGHVIGVATAAMRDAGNGAEVIERARAELGLSIEIIGSEKEALYGCIGGIQGLPAHDGIAFDLGGGSVQVTEFRHRKPGATCSLPLGSLRLSEAFIREDPPAKREIRSLRNHVHNILQKTLLPQLERGGALIGIGGTIRNLAKVDAHLHTYPISRIHGYALTRKRLDGIVDLLCENPLRTARKITGISHGREDSIIGGALAIQALVERLDAAEIVVSGQGLREGLVYSLAAGAPPNPDDLREAALRALAVRFSTWNPEFAERRRAIASQLLASLMPLANGDIAKAVQEGAFILDIGCSVDFFSRFKLASSVVLNTDLDGFSHRNILLLATLIANAHDEDAGLPLLELASKDVDKNELKRAAVVLKMADDIVQRWSGSSPAMLDCKIGSEEIQIHGSGLECWAPRAVAPRFERLFDRRLVIRANVGKEPMASIHVG